MMQIQPYLFFDGRCDEALAFYKSALGAQVDMLMRFKDAPPQSGEMGSCQPNIDPQKVMHASFRVGDAVLMASDGMAQGKPEFKALRSLSTSRTTTRRSASSTRSAPAAPCSSR